ncbi:MAG: hypothetical protein RI928_1707 [Pseudomonadota bacterium]|jgi:hypothetical protein
MLKILVAFIIFAAISLFVLFKSDGNISMQGEAGGHDTNQTHEAPKPATEAPAADNAAPAPAPAASTDTEKK